MEKILFKEEVYNIIGCCMEVHNTLGYGFKEIVYKDALEIEFQRRNIPYIREPIYKIDYKGEELPHGFQADFMVYDQIIIEAKSRAEIDSSDQAQTFNYLRASKQRLGVLVNFGELRLNYKRLII